MPACAPNIAPSETRIRVCCAANTVDRFSAKSSLHADAKKEEDKILCDFCGFCCCFVVFWVTN